MLQLVSDSYTIAMSQLELAGDFSNDSAMQAAFDGASSAFAQPPSSDLRRAFWYHPGLLSYGNVTIKTLLPGTLEASTCAAVCASDDECATFAFSYLERLCFLLSTAHLNFCDPDGSETCAERSDGLLAELAHVSDCKYCVFYRSDSAAMYCASNSNQCATLREYHQCLQDKGCGEDANDWKV